MPKKCFACADKVRDREHVITLRPQNLLRLANRARMEITTARAVSEETVGKSGNWKSTSQTELHSTLEGRQVPCCAVSCAKGL